jgi:hypothetical protein
MMLEIGANAHNQVVQLQLVPQQVVLPLLDRVLSSLVAVVTDLVIHATTALDWMMRTWYSTSSTLGCLDS